MNKPWDEHSFGVPAEPVYCIECKVEIDPRLDASLCPKCLAPSVASLTDLEFEALSEKMYDDSECQSAFVAKRYDDFEEYMFQRDIHHDDYCDHEIDFCEHLDDEYMDFAFDYYNKIK